MIEAVYTLLQSATSLLCIRMTSTLVTDRLDAANHEGRRSNGHIEIIKLLCVAELEHGLGKAFRHILTTLHAPINIIDQATVNIHQILV